jgi:hypothetical protein
LKFRFEAALLSQEGSVIAWQSREGWFLKENLQNATIEMIPLWNHPGASHHLS